MSQGSVSFVSHRSVVDSAAGYETLYFLNAYFEYHQIAMCIANQLATAFITPFGLLLQDDALRAQKHGRHILEVHATCLCRSHRMNHRGVHR
jgi:hypothetical protein